MSTAAAWGWTGAMSRAGRECFRRVMAGTSSGPGWRGGAARKNQFPNRDRLGVTTLKSAAARGPSFVSGSGPPKTGRPLPSAADHSAGCFCRHRRNEFRDRFVAHDLSGLCRRDRMLPEVRMARIIDAIGLHQAKKLSCVEAAELLGMSERHFRRLRDAYEAHGAEGIVDRRRGRASGRRAGVDEIEWVIEEFRTRYFDFTAKHFHEAIHGRPMADGTPFSRGYTWTKSVLQVRGLVSKAPKRSAHRKKRARRPLPGLLLFQDGSKHAWLPQGPGLDLVVTLDDATSAMLSAVLVEEEGTASSFVGLQETIAAHGLSRLGIWMNGWEGLFLAVRRMGCFRAGCEFGTEPAHAPQPRHRPHPCDRHRRDPSRRGPAARPPAPAPERVRRPRRCPRALARALPPP